jgi:hypothetical protein
MITLNGSFNLNDPKCIQIGNRKTLNTFLQKGHEQILSHLIISR